ncbi:LamG domain-containing protein [Opitutaceae bacterium TAV4]|nr:LamG domain-containing protein [Opitutaceae bacterium TAV4]RRJ99363.1 LamG domain-containing protein [Opitutaceae bacterium TAV3]
MKTKTLLCLLPLLTTFVPVVVRAQSGPLIRYDFASVTGDLIEDVSGNNRSGSLIGTGVQGADKTGVSGQTGDRAFNNTASTMGYNTVPTGGGGVSAPSLGNLSSFTVTLWFKTDGKQPLKNSARLFDASNRFVLAGLASGRVALTYNLGSGNSGTLIDVTDTTTLANQDPSWVFIALTYDGTSTTGLDNVKIYAGSASESVKLIGSNSSVSITGIQNLPTLYFGVNGPAGGRAFDGWLDDIRVYGNASTGAGALSIEALDAVRLQSIPESAMTALFAGGAGLFALVAWRYRAEK